ncbi:MAG: host attachment protein [Sedimenticola sp.]|uniref:Host attachment protein n=1 Tax=Sedimenticola thiotaurini TaxID=1543721 RepID=A0A558D0N1_9GAMM|nr:host attachment protein [Sedimenticola sp.]TVT54579.1 MAG: host attachment protein [Sedimenticola thiotaurini]MCW8947606.1 host attachment protein [Sedimenticola sp.]MCW8950201.1 host attachment protein [Sedimenticola sp.]MCW8975627.1 host attachment protein [Sedimenticola sp.]
MNAAWVVVADTSRARIFSAENAFSPLVEIQTLDHPEARLHPGDLVSDKSGRDRSTGARSHDIGHLDEAKHDEAVRFASEVCAALESGRANGHFNKLHVIAAPSFLGLLRKQQPQPLQKLVATEISKNLTTQDIKTIRKNLPNRL